ncbi:unnamed protein product [Cyclocybe aegerita]|uniref:Uncharacterized protein n=1 Tax=Cyclocybe aegerita TaxID=1973307 RepID=A0A8S0VV20_CYCAE|nr:unnamed protein product [Cyclocybe aegerita]
MAHLHPHPTLDIDIDSPASASSSTLITPLPLPLNSLAHKVSSPDLGASPQVRTVNNTRKRPSLSLSLGSGGRVGEGRGGRGETRVSGVMGAAPEGRMSGKGFIEPHKSHLPRRARTTVRRGTTVASNGVDGGGVRVTSTPARRTVQHLQSPTEASTVAPLDLDVDNDHGRERDGERGEDPLQTGLTTLTEPPTSPALPGPPYTSIPPTPTPGQGSYAPTTPTPPHDAHVVGPTRSTIISNTIDAVLASAQAQSALDAADGKGRGMNTSHHHPALGLTMSLAAIANSSSKLPPPGIGVGVGVGGQPPPPRSQPPGQYHLMSLSLSQNAAAATVGSPVPHSSGVFATPGVSGMPGLAPTTTPGYGTGQGQGTPAPTRGYGPASPGPALALAPVGVTPATAGVIRFRERDEGRLRTPARAQSTSRPPTRIKRHGSASRTRELTTDDLRRMARVERERRRGRACVQRVGAGMGGGRVEVGFLEEEWDLEGGWFEGDEGETKGEGDEGESRVEEERGRSRSRSRDGGADGADGAVEGAVGEGGEGQEERGRGRKDKGKGKGKAPYILIKVLGAPSSLRKLSASSSSSSSGLSSSSSSSDSDNDNENDADTDSNATSNPPLRPHRPKTLRLPLPSERSAYIDGVPSLSPSQLREACDFIGSWVHPSPDGVEGRERRKLGGRVRVRVRVLAPRWRPEEAMGVVLCYLAGRWEVEDGVEEDTASRSPEGEIVSPRVNDLVYFAPGSILPSDCLPGGVNDEREPISSSSSNPVPQPNPDAASPSSVTSPTSTPIPTSTSPSAHLPTPDVYTYSALHILAMRLLDDDSKWMGRGALYEARIRQQERAEEDVFGSFPLDVPAPSASSPDANTTTTTNTENGVHADADAHADEGEVEGGGGSDADTICSSTEDGRDRRGRRHAREGAEWRLALRSASAPAPSHAVSLSLLRGNGKREGEEREGRRRRAKTRERGGLGTSTRKPRKVEEGRMGEDGEDDGLEEEEEEWTGLQDAWRGVLSYDGLVRLAGVLYGEGTKVALTTLDAASGSILSTNILQDPQNPCGNISEAIGDADLTPSGDQLVLVFGDGQVTVLNVDDYLENGFRSVTNSEGKITTHPFPETPLSTRKNKKERKAHEEGYWSWVDKAYYGDGQVVLRPGVGEKKPTGFAVASWK